MLKLLIGLGLLLMSSSAQAVIGDPLGLSPFWDWKTIESENFRVTFPAELGDTAQKVTHDLEEAHSILSPRLYWKPWNKTQVLVIDNADAANGLTSPLLRLGLILYVTPPDPFFSTTYYDDWLRLLCIHEYTHLLNMDATRDFYVPLRYLTGNAFLPNSAWPSWMLEGLAVYMETRFTHSGRGRSPFYEMILRAAVEQNVLDDPRFITLDRINGDNPYNPSGETAYLFGYQLMNQIAQEPIKDGKTADRETSLRDGEDALGVMSLRSAGRIPYFINGNLENILGKDWYKVWDEWVAKTRTRALTELALIRSKPVTKTTLLTSDNAIETLGPAPSPDGQWVAYTSDTPDSRSALYLLKLKDHQSRRIGDKLLGSTAAFAPDSKAVFYSKVEKRHEYYLWSDLAVYDLERDRTYSLTEDLRARDPDVSRDGRRITFTVTEKGTTRLATAALERSSADGKYHLGAIQRLPVTQKYDRVATPKFSADGKRILYSLHRMGHFSEEIMAIDITGDLDSAHPIELVSDGRFNRYPAIAPDGDIYYISDRTGVENLYRLSKQGLPEMISNVTTGLAYPAFGPDGLYASLYTGQGWGLARVELDPQLPPYVAAELTIAAPPTPQADGLSDDHASHSPLTIQNYSLFPSLWPRQWLVVPIFYPGGIFVQTEAAGFDAVDRHSYAVALGFNSGIPAVDWLGIYSNRSLGPTLALEASQRTTGFDTADTGGVTTYTRKSEAQAYLSFPLLYTYSSLIPTIGFNAERDYNYAKGIDPSNGDLIYKSVYVPSADVSVLYSNTESSRLAISPEAGRSTVLGARMYSDSGTLIYKGVFKDNEYIRIQDHAVLNPSIKALLTSAFDSNFGDANAVAEGRTPQLLTTPLSSVFGSLPIRGYPFQTYYSRALGVGALDFRFPLIRAYRGWGTNPIFIDQLYGFTFAEAAYFPLSDSGTLILPSAGGGLRLSTEVLLHIPVTLALEFHQGFREAYGGKTDLFINLQLGTLQF